MSLEDLEGSLRVVIPASVYQRERHTLKGRGPYIIEGRVEMDPDAHLAHLRAEKIWRPG
jgi:DNA polymerase III alpha subunit